MNPEQFENLQKSVERIEKAVTGDPAIGLTGLAPRMAKLEAWARRMDLRIATFVGGGIVIAAIIERILK